MSLGSRGTIHKRTGTSVGTLLGNIGQSFITDMKVDIEEQIGSGITNRVNNLVQEG